jgi:hypothetical protein
MKRLFILTVVLVIIAVACNKDKFTTIPQLKLDAISPTTVITNDIISLRGKFTDKEGDLDSILVIYKWFNGSTEVFPFDTFRYSFENLNVPPKTTDADILLQFQYNNSDPNGYAKLPGLSRDTTAAFGIILKDEEANRSEYKESEKIRIKKP